MDALASDKTGATPPLLGEAQPTRHEPVRLNGYMDVVPATGRRLLHGAGREDASSVGSPGTFPKTHVGPAFQPVKTG